MTNFERQEKKIKWILIHSTGMCLLFLSMFRRTKERLDIAIRHSLVARIAGSHPAGGGSIPPDGDDLFDFFPPALGQSSLFFTLQEQRYFEKLKFLDH